MASKAPLLLRPILRRVTTPLRVQPSPSAAVHSIPRPRRPRLRWVEDETYTPEDREAESLGPQTELRHAYYQISFTCIPCGHRSHHSVSKQGYHFGSTLITCPGCRNRHVISDHLDIFGDRKVTVEDLMREKGRLVKRGTIGEDGNVEFWPEKSSDGRRVPRKG